MAAKTKLYPIRDRWVHDAPSIVQVVEDRAEAERLIASGAFTDDPKHPGRDRSAADTTEPEK